MVTMYTFELIDKVFVNFIRFIIVVIELKICIDMLTACMEYNIFAFIDFDSTLFA